MIRLLFALMLVGALGHALRSLFTRRTQAARKLLPAQRPAASRTRQMVTSAGLSLLVGGAVVLLFFVTKLVYLEVTQVAPAAKAPAAGGGLV